MMDLTGFFKRVTLGFVLASVPIVGGCGGNTGSHAATTWQEEVKLLDGRVIIITQKRRYDNGKMPREFWLSFKLPEFSNQEIAWHENLSPRVLNVYQGKLYVVGAPWTTREFEQYGKPKPSYLGYRYEAGRWQLVPFNEIPVAIYDTNLLIEGEPPRDMKFATFAMKAEEMAEEKIGNSVKRIDPKYVVHNY